MTLSVHPWVGDNKITTSAKLLDITYESYGFSCDLIKIQHGKAGFNWGNYKFHCYV